MSVSGGNLIGKILIGDLIFRWFLGIRWFLWSKWSLSCRCRIPMPVSTLDSDSACMITPFCVLRAHLVTSFLILGSDLTSVLALVSQRGAATGKCTPPGVVQA